MFSLIIVIISIALVALLALATIYYGGTAYSNYKASAEASTLTNQASQLYAASMLYKQSVGTWPASPSVLLNALPDGSVPLNSLPVPPQGTLAMNFVKEAIAQTTQNWEFVLDGNGILTYITLPDYVRAETCVLVNDKANSTDSLLGQTYEQRVATIKSNLAEYVTANGTLKEEYSRFVQVTDGGINQLSEEDRTKLASLATIPAKIDPSKTFQCANEGITKTGGSPAYTYFWLAPTGGDKCGTAMGGYNTSNSSAVGCGHSASPVTPPSGCPVGQHPDGGSGCLCDGSNAFPVNGTCSALVFSPASPLFDSVASGGAGVPVNIVLTNQGSSPVTPVITVKGSGGMRWDLLNGVYSGTGELQHFRVASSTCTGSLAPAGTCDIQVQFTPKMAGVVAGYSLAAQEGSTSTSANLTGTATPCSVCAVSPPTVTGDLGFNPPEVWDSADVAILATDISSSGLNLTSLTTVQVAGQPNMVWDTTATSFYFQTTAVGLSALNKSQPYSVAPVVATISSGGSWDGHPISGGGENPSLSLVTAWVDDGFPQEFAFATIGDLISAYPWYGDCWVIDQTYRSNNGLSEGFGCYGVVADGTAVAGAGGTPTVNTLAGEILVFNQPNILGVTPAIIPNTGNVQVSVTGSFFLAGTQVSVSMPGGNVLGWVPVEVSKSGANGLLTFSIPVGVYPGGTAFITIQDPRTGTGAGGGGVLNFSIPVAQAPTISSVAPNSGSVAGGTAVVITGTGFIAGSTVTFDGMPATSATVQSATSIQAVAPAHTEGSAPVVVANGNGQASSSFQYKLKPVLSLLAPATASSLGGTAITVTGLNFKPGAVVKVNGTNMPTTYVSTTELWFVAGTSADATQPVQVSNSDGEFSNIVSLAFSYGGEPAITGLYHSDAIVSSGNLVGCTLGRHVWELPYRVRTDLQGKVLAEDSGSCNMNRSQISMAGSEYAVAEIANLPPGTLVLAGSFGNLTIEGRHDITLGSTMTKTVLGSWADVPANTLSYVSFKIPAGGKLDGNVSMTIEGSTVAGSLSIIRENWGAWILETTVSGSGVTLVPQFRAGLTPVAPAELSPTAINSSFWQPNSNTPVLASTTYRATIQYPQLAEGPVVTYPSITTVPTLPLGDYWYGLKQGYGIGTGYAFGTGDFLLYELSPIVQALQIEVATFACSTEQGIPANATCQMASASNWWTINYGGNPPGLASKTIQCTGPCNWGAVAGSIITGGI